MHRIVVDESLKRQLGQVDGPCELFDADGNRLGLFRPEMDLNGHEELSPSVSDEELERRSREGGGRTLAEIMADLERQA